MSLDAMDWVWTNSQSKGVARLVMLAIADKAKGSTCKAFAGLTFLQERANAGRSTVVGAVRDLTDSGELEIVEGETGPYGAAVYRLPKAVGHVRSDGSASRKSVQNLHRSTRGIRADIGSVSAPIDGPADCEIGSESAPDGESAPADIGTDTAPIEPMPERQIGADSAPIPEPPYAEIGADSGRQSVQILDDIGAESAPPIHQTPTEHQEPLLPADSGTLFAVDVVAPQSRTGKPRGEGQAKKPKKVRTPEDQERFEIADALTRTWYEALPIKPSGEEQKVFLAVRPIVEGLLKVGNKPDDVAEAARRCSRAITRNAMEYQLVAMERETARVVVPQQRSDTPPVYQNPPTSAGYSGGWRNPNA